MTKKNTTILSLTLILIVVIVVSSFLFSDKTKIVISVVEVPAWKADAQFTDEDNGTDVDKYSLNEASDLPNNRESIS